MTGNATVAAPAPVEWLPIAMLEDGYWLAAAARLLQNECDAFGFEFGLVVVAAGGTWGGLLGAGAVPVCRSVEEWLASASTIPSARRGEIWMDNRHDGDGDC